MGLVRSSVAIDAAFHMTGDVTVKKIATMELMKKDVRRVLVPTQNSGNVKMKPLEFPFCGQYYMYLCLLDG